MLALAKVELLCVKAPIRSGLVEGQSERERNTQGAKPSGVYLVLHSAQKKNRERCGSIAVQRQQAMVWPGGLDKNKMKLGKWL